MTASNLDRSTVALVKGSDPLKTTLRALKIIQDEVVIDPSERVLIKPNCVRPVSPETGVTTDAGVVEAIINFLTEKGVKDLVIADGGNP